VELRCLEALDHDPSLAHGHLRERVPIAIESGLQLPISSLTQLFDLILRGSARPRAPPIYRPRRARRREGSVGELEVVDRSCFIRRGRVESIGTRDELRASAERIREIYL